MISTIIVGIIFVLILGFATKKTVSDLKKGKCAGCSACDTKPSKTCDVKF
ncbi:MAG: FeoB-associated Cys-rich membrane protein [Acidaminobacteraceae bacterium]